MDLFGDLPDPEKNDAEGKNQAANGKSKEKNDTEGKSQAANGKSKECIFEDLPQTSSSAKTTAIPYRSKPSAEKRKSVEEPPESPAPKKLAAGLHTLKGYFAERQGERDDMQDAHTIIDDLTTRIENLHESINRLSYYGVFDGHGGSRASKYAASKIHTNIIQRFPKGNVEQVERDMKKCLVESFKRTDEEFLRQARSVKPSWKDGSTAVTVLAVNDNLFIANLGDSKAVLCRYNDNIKKCTAIPLSKDHSPTQYEERIRIQKAGGQVREGRVMGQLEVSRSIGDGPYKNHGVSSVPDVKRCQLMDNDRYVLIACDGLWKRFDNESAIEFINKILEDSSHEQTDFKTLEEVKFESACTQLANEAVRRLSADNVTVLLVAIGNNKPS